LISLLVLLLNRIGSWVIDVNDYDRGRITVQIFHIDHRKPSILNFRRTCRRFKAKPGLTICESFESDAERQLDLARGQSG